MGGGPFLLHNGEPDMDTYDWRTQLSFDSRQKVVNKILDTLKKQIPFCGQEGINELSRIAVRFEEKIFSRAVNPSDYLRIISLKMLTVEGRQYNAAGSSSYITADNDIRRLEVDLGHLVISDNSESSLMKEECAVNTCEGGH
ncbi:Mediator of RNA polymerase II transcription subunit 15a [Raphanus sativus]|nr:Mediator of RNA polymerase II transcription subunit 15a [Raphanus sativus]